MNKAYRNAPPEQVEQLMRFRNEHPLQTWKADGITWEYITSGEPSGQALLLLPGALGIAESSWRTISLLEEQRKYRLVCPSYPAEVSTMTALADGIAGVLDKEGVGDTTVVGGSYGGMLAQVFTRRHQQRVTRLVLSHTYPPVRERARSVEPALRLFRVLPMFILKKMLRDRMTGILPPKPTPELRLVAAQIRETVDTKMTRQAALNTFQRMMDFDQQDYSAADLQGWQGKALIMLAEDDPTTPEKLRQALLELYPGARLHLFKGSGHATAILETGEYIRLMDEFLSTPVQAG